MKHRLYHVMTPGELIDVIYETTRTLNVRTAQLVLALTIIAAYTVAAVLQWVNS